MSATTRMAKAFMVARLAREFAAPLLVTSGALLTGVVGAIAAERAWRKRRAVR